MISVINYPYYNSYINSLTCIGIDDKSPIINWLLYGRIVENPIVQPTNSTQYIYPSGKNRTLGYVTVKAQSPKVYSVAITSTASTTISIAGASTAQSVATVATTAVTNNTVTITGVAAGTTTVRVYDATNNLIALIVTTVTA